MIRLQAKRDFDMHWGNMLSLAMLWVWPNVSISSAWYAGRIPEDWPAQPVNIYGQQKVDGEQVVQHILGESVLVIRISVSIQQKVQPKYKRLALRGHDSFILCTSNCLQIQI